MVKTRPENKLPKIADSYKPKSKPKPKARRKIEMEKEGSTTPPVQEEGTGSPSALEAELIANFAASQPAPSLLDDTEEAVPEEPAKTPAEKEAAEEKEKSTSPPKPKKKRSDSTPSSTKTPASTSRTISSPKPTEEEAEKEISAAGSSSNKASSDEDEEEAPPPPKKPKVEPRSSKRVKKAQATKAKAHAKEEAYQRELTVPKAIEWKLLEQLEIAEEVKQNFANIGWAEYLQWDTTVYSDLTREFFENLEVELDRKGEPRNLYFKLNGVERMVSINELNMYLGMVTLKELTGNDYVTAEKQIPEKMDYDAAWSELAKEGKFISCSSKGTSLKSPAMRICHRILSYNFYGKTDSSNTISKPELFLLWAMYDKRKVNFAAMVAHHFRQIIAKGQRLCLCNLPGVFAKNQELLSFSGAMAVEKRDSFDLRTLQKMFKVQPVGKGKLKMTEESDKPLPKPARGTTSSTPEPLQEDAMAALARLQQTVNEIKEAQLAFFASRGFRYPPESP